MNRVNLWGAAGLLLVVSGGLVPRLSAQDVVLGRDPAVTVGTLPNGFRYYIRANRRPENRADLRLVVDAGSVLEDDDQRGLAHFAEHMAFNGTARFPKQEIIDYLERIGMRFGAHLNASTHFDQTIYELRVPTDSAEIMRTAFDILEDWSSAVTFDSVEIDAERGVVLEEWRLGRGAWARITDQHFPVLFSGSRYADRLPIGTPENLRTFPYDAVRRFYRDWYRPDLMALVAVGDFDPAEIERLVVEHFSGLVAPAIARERVSYDVPGHADPLYAVATDPEETNTIVTVYFKRQARTQETIGAYRTSIIERLFSGMFNDRLFEIQFQPDAPFIFASVSQGRFVRPLETWGLTAGVRDGDVLPGLEALLTEAERVARYGFTETELERRKIEVLRGMERAYAEREKNNSSRFAGEYVRHFLEGEPFPGIAAEYELYQRLLPTIALEEVNRVAELLLADRNRVVLVGGPERLAMPTDVELSAVFDRVAVQPLAPYVDAVTDAPLMAGLPESGSVVSRTEHPTIGVTEWRLSNGARVVLKPTDFQDDEIVFRALSPGGTSLASDEDYVAAMTASTIVGASGVGEFDVFELQKLLVGKVATVYPEIYGIAEGFSGRASPQDLETLFQLLHLYFVAPRRDSSAYLAVQQQNQEFVRNRGASPEVAFSDTLTAILTQNHYRARPFSSELFDEMDLDTSFDFYRARFADASDFVFVFVGNFQSDAIEPLVTRYLASLPSIERNETWVDHNMVPPTGLIRREVRRGIEPKSQTQLVFTGPFEYSRENAHLLSSMTSILDIWLRESLREDLGATYGASVGGSAQRVPRPSFRVGINFSSSPERGTEMLETTCAELERMKTEGPSEDDLQKIQEGQRRSRETALRQNGFWLDRLMTQARYGLSLEAVLEFDALVDGLTRVRIRDAARRWLPFDNYVLVTLYPETVN